MTDIDLFLIIGQSNAEGRGDKSTSPIVPAGKVLRYYFGSSIVDANDPIYTGHTMTLAGNTANGGSAWPAFGARYYQSTGRLVGFVLAPVGGSSQVAAADIGAGNWDASGALYGASTTIMAAAITAYTTAGYNPIVKGILCMNGETDALGITAALIVEADYVSAMNVMIARYRAEAWASASLPFYIFRTGDEPDVPAQAAGFASIRSAQETVATGDFYTRIIWREGAYTNSHSMYGAGSHYNQAGYNRAGERGAMAIVAGDFDRKPSSYPGDAKLYYEEGGIIIGGSIQAAETSGFKLGTRILAKIDTNGYVSIRDYNGNGAILLGSASDATSYYRNTHHKIQTINGGSTFVTY